MTVVRHPEFKDLKELVDKKVRIFRENPDFPYETICTVKTVGGGYKPGMIGIVVDQNEQVICIWDDTSQGGYGTRIEIL